ncbi:hypothetical protein E2C01_081776 [Portunus trituberculatus]|uniref:Uncharacterized protein n=1 Tax=Portunus trituberculatus TaxID=210409 RepID=A0A5B7IXI7_PORTR|nr:hypothetical protein [Portunus trituberculatus]
MCVVVSGADSCVVEVGVCVVVSGADSCVMEVDNPVGNDNHKVNGRLLFEAEPGHASVLPVNNLVKAEDLLGKESLTLEHGGRPAPPKRPAHVITKSDNQLGTDMNSMTPFHMLAFEQLTTPTSQRGPGPPPPYSEKDWELLPHMTYGQKNSMTNKVTHAATHHSVPFTTHHHRNLTHCQSPPLQPHHSPLTTTKDLPLTIHHLSPPLEPHHSLLLTFHHSPPH